MEAISLTLSKNEAQLVLSALLAVTRTGGGSEQWNLFRKLSEQTGIEVDYALVGRLQEIAHREYEENGEA